MSAVVGPVRLAVVVPRYGEEVLGGAETAVRKLMEHLPPRFQVEVLTTCARDLDWRNAYPPGEARLNGVRVRRFPVDHRFRDERRYRELTLKFSNGWPTTVDEEYEWIDQNAHSPMLYAFVRRHSERFDRFLFAPYLFGTTFYGTALVPEKSIVWPHLHDEPFARFEATRLMMEACRGILFNTEPEMKLALDRLGVRNPGARLVGEGVDDWTADGERFRRRHRLEGPFMLYAGRLDSMKNVLLLLSFFEAYKQARPGSSLKLVLIGDGPLPLPNRPDILHLGFVPEQEKHDAFAAAAVVCQPSLMESFSIVVMEAWLADVPVLVHGDCAVTRYHIRRCGGGLYFTTADEFIETLDWFLEHPGERQRMGQQGRAYVRREYSWERVLQRFDAALQDWM